MSATEESHQIRLLEDALGESEIALGNRADSWAATLGAVRQRRGSIQRRRRLGWAATAVAAVSLVVVATTWFLAPPRAQVTGSGPTSRSRNNPNPLEIVRSSAPNPAMRVRTAADGLAGVRSRPMAFLNVHTGELRPPVVVDDAALFALLAGRPAAIVRHPGAPAELLLLDEL